MHKSEEFDACYPNLVKDPEPVIYFMADPKPSAFGKALFLPFVNGLA